MKAVILAGGLRIWLSEETAAIRLKPMVEIGGKPDSLCHREDLRRTWALRNLSLCSPTR